MAALKGKGPPPPIMQGKGRKGVGKHSIMCDSRRLVEFDSDFNKASFILEGREWQSVSQFYDACRHQCPSLREDIRTSRIEYVSNLGRDFTLVPNFNHLEAIYLATNAKFRQNPDLQAMLVATKGSFSVPLGKGCWQETTMWEHFHPLVLQLVREELKPLGERDEAWLTSIKRDFANFGFDEDTATKKVETMMREYERLSVPIEVVVGALDGQQSCLHVRPREDIRSLKVRIAETVGMHPARIHLLFDDAPLEDDDSTVDEAGIKDGDSLTLIAQPLGLALGKLGGHVSSEARSCLLDDIRRIRRD
eukprot:TRINITY_DN7203_c0_g1_i1.p1 TRINITY_DN7203_c0_g1~~TRINITY_DN7203_c0_g1_i1.p1  ORF type:complete len:306 (+),score=36.75 TRINITY_DN7203_c0_g1_i1:99-1016(+)